jgi:hypothetical protein
MTLSRIRMSVAAYAEDGGYNAEATTRMATSSKIVISTEAFGPQVVCYKIWLRQRSSYTSVPIRDGDQFRREVRFQRNCARHVTCLS